MVLGFIPTAVLAWAVISMVGPSVIAESKWPLLGLVVGAALVVQAVGAVCMVKQWRHDRALAIEAGLITPYIANGFFCVVVYGGPFSGFIHPNIGWLLTLIAASGLGFELELIGYQTIRIWSGTF